MKTFITLLLAFMAMRALGAEARHGTYIINSTLPLNAVEIAPEYVVRKGDFWSQPPEARPADVPKSCVLVAVYQRQKDGALRFVGWTFIEGRDRDRLHGRATSTVTLS